MASSSSADDPNAFDNWAHGRVKVKDVSIHFRYAGRGPPLLLVHGNPQHSLTWRLIGPRLTSSFTVIAPDNRGMGDSTLAPDNDYSAEAMAGDLKGLLDFVGVSAANKVLVFSHDKGCGAAAALAALHRDLVAAVVFAEYVLPGYGYEPFSAPAPGWDLYANWQLAFFSVPDAAEFFIRGREREMLSWYFWHGSYAGTSSVPGEVLSRYADAIGKPGFLRAMLGPFATYSVAKDNALFARTLAKEPLAVPVLALGGEASIAPAGLLRQLWGGVVAGGNVEVDVVPHAGHWIGDENPGWVAERMARFFGPVAQGMAALDLGWLDGKVTLV